LIAAKKQQQEFESELKTAATEDEDKSDGEKKE